MTTPIDGSPPVGSPGGHSAAHSAELRTRVGGPAVTPPAWRRFSLVQSFAWGELPVAVVTLINAILFTAIVFSSDENYDTLQAWFRTVDAHLEGNVSTWVNAALWLTAGVIAVYIARNVMRHTASWWIFAAACIFFSIDETVMVHEELNVIFSDFGESLPFTTFAWVIPGLILAGLLALPMLRMVLSLPTASRNGLLLGGSVFIIGSIGFDALGGLTYYENGYTGWFVVLATIEEALEMTGVALCIAAMLHLIEWTGLEDGTAYRVNAMRADGAQSRKPKKTR